MPKKCDGCVYLDASKKCHYRSETGLWPNILTLECYKGDPPEDEEPDEPTETHVVEMVIQRFYRVSVELKAGEDLSTEQIVERAKQMVLDHPECLDVDEELEVEPDDIVSASYSHEVC